MFYIRLFGYLRDLRALAAKRKAIGASQPFHHHFGKAANLNSMVKTHLVAIVLLFSHVFVLLRTEGLSMDSFLLLAVQKIYSIVPQKRKRVL